MSSKLVLVICALVAVAAAVPAPGPAGGLGGPVGPWGGPGVGGWGGPGAGGWGGAGAAGPWGGWIPPWVASAPWYPQWVACTGIGSSCMDCSTRVICTKMGGLQRACTDPALPYCNLGECSATPAAGCGPVPVAPAETAV